MYFFVFHFLVLKLLFGYLNFGHSGHQLLFALLMLFNFLNRIKPSDFDYLKIIGKGSFGKVCISIILTMKMSTFIS